MMSFHKWKRMKKRSYWKKIKKLDEKLKKPSIKSKKYEQIKKYEQRKSKKNKNKIQKNENKSVIKIDLKSSINFKHHANDLVSVTKKIENSLKDIKRKKFIIDHSNIKNASVGGLLYLVGQISKITHTKYGSSRYNLNYQKKYGLDKNNEKLKYLFYKIGYWKYFGISKPYKINLTTKKEYFLAIESHNQNKINLLNNIKKFINNNVGLFKNNYKLEYKFDDIVKEAMGNSLEHAYYDDFNEIGKERGKWWICGHYDKKDEILEILFYDYGIGIRASMKRNLGDEAKIALVDKVSDKLFRNDADLIEMAIQGDLSKYKNYKEHDRGKGFKRFQDFAISSGYSCELTVISNKGKYQFNYDILNKDTFVHKEVLNDNIDGMLIKWKIKLGGIYGRNNRNS